MENLLATAFGPDASQLAAAERQRLLSRLLSRLAHEVRNPLSSLDVHVQLLEEDLARMTPPVPAPVSGRLEIIGHELRRLDGIVRQFLTLAGPATPNLQPVDLRALLQHVCELLGADAQARDIELRAIVSTSLPEVWADPNQLAQALINLVINALQAIEGRGRVEITAGLSGSEAVCIEVRDTGPGVDPGKRLTVFEPFFTTKPEGTGLGLWIVQQIATAHHGSVAVTDAPGGGAAFTV